MMNLSSCLQKKDEMYQKRISALQESLKDRSLDALVIEDPLDLSYLTGMKFSVGQLWIGKWEKLLLVDDRYIAEASLQTFVPTLLKSWKAVSDFILKNQIKIVGFDGAKSTFQGVEELKEKTESFLSWISNPWITKKLREVKEKEEISLLKQSASILWEGYLYIKTLLQEGITEKEVAKKFEIFCLQKGAEGLSFEPIIAFGENSAFPHYRAGERKLKQGDIVLIDIGVIFKQYASDMTRVVFFGKPDPLLSSWLDIIIEAQKNAFSICHPGTLFQDLDKAAREVLKKEKVEEYFIHSLGHGIGLEVHESPRIRFDREEGILKPGMVFTLEPGLYLPGRGGVRYEDMIVVTQQGAENLFPFDKAFL